MIPGRVRQWKTQNPELVKAQRRRHYVAHAEQVRTAVAAWKVSHREAFRETNRKYRETHRSQRLEYDQQRSARKRGQTPQLIDRAAIYSRDGGQCQLCGLPVLPKNRSLDHVVPLALGGAHTPENVQLAHLLCNQRKGKRSTLSLRPDRPHEIETPPQEL